MKRKRLKRYEELRCHRAEGRISAPRKGGRERQQLKLGMVIKNYIHGLDFVFFKSVNVGREEC